MRSRSDEQRALAAGCLLLILVYAILVLRHGWIVDDAYITVRTVDNFFAGYGLVWNPGERVQAYTHPLWMLLLCVFHGLSGEFFYSLIIMGTLISVAALALVTLRLARSQLVALALILVASLSHAFVDYSTSGLENPLTHLLIAIAAWVYLGQLPSARRLMLLCLIGGLALLSRPDNALLLGPLVIAAAVQAWRRGESWRELARAVLLGGVPLFAWELFSLFYYGMLVPNTALAKLNSGIESRELIEQGFFYLVATLDLDPLTLVVILAGMFVPLLVDRRRPLPLSIGIALHLLYLIKIGGDFMLGRFLTAPFFMALICLAQLRRVSLVPLALVSAVLVALGLSAHPNTFEINSELSESGPTGRSHRRITDERVFLYQAASLVHAHRTRPMPDHMWTSDGLMIRESGKRVRATIAMGFRGVAGGPDVHWLDRAALTDPLLSRLPAQYNPQWMAGHYLRAIPRGYHETLETGVNHLRSPRLAELYHRVTQVTRGDLWSRERFAAIWWLNTSGPSELVSEESWRFYGASKRTPSSLRWRVDDGTPLDSKQVRNFTNPGVYVKFKHRQHPEVVELSLNGDDLFELRFYDGAEEIARVPVPRRRLRGKHGIVARRIELPEVVSERGFMRMRILPRTRRWPKTPYYGIGHMLFDEEIETAPHITTRPEPDPGAKAGVSPTAEAEPDALLEPELELEIDAELDPDPRAAVPDGGG